MEKKVLNFIDKNKMLKYGDSVILGVSGGADSLCMLDLLHRVAKQMELKLTVVHVNHNIRGEEAYNDQIFVENFCEKISVKCVTYQVNVKQMAKEMKCSEEEAGRYARYKLFQETLEKENADKIAVAHNLNDNSETVLFNLFRGSGIKGMCGITPVRDNIIRPIMCLTRKEIEEYVKENNLQYRTDSTNLENDYTRNKIRNEILPYVESNINKGVINNISNMAAEMTETEEYINMQVEEMFDKIVTKCDRGYIIKDECIHILLKKRIIRRIINSLSGRLKDVTRLHIDSVVALFDKRTGCRVDLPYNIVGVREYNGVGIYLNQLINKEKTTMEERELMVGDKLFPCELMDVEFVTVMVDSENISENKYTKWIDCDKIKDRLVLRNRMSGDYITITNTGKKKKLKDFFIDEKVPREQRDSVLLVADGHCIVWIVGYRISAEYKISKETKRVIKLCCKEKKIKYEEKNG